MSSKVVLAFMDEDEVGIRVCVSASHQFNALSEYSRESHVIFLAVSSINRSCLIEERGRVCLRVSSIQNMGVFFACDF